MALTGTGKDGGGQDKSTRDRVWVETDGNRRPFMRGIMVHSLMARGVGFDEALLTADEVRSRVEGRGRVQRHELAKLIEELLGSGAVAEHQPPIPIPAAILVRGDRRPLPFSKGTLAQSLLASSIDPSDAFEVAREIESELIRRDEKEVTRAELRQLAFHTLLQRLGRQTAERYLVWREYQEHELPVIILLGGTTGAGKTSLALEVARRLGIRRVLSTDSIRQVMRIMLSPELVPTIHASSFDAHRYLARETLGEDPVVEGFMQQASVVSVGVRGILDRAVAENTSLVLDGVTLVPGLIDLEAYADKAHVIFLLVATLGDEAFLSRFETRGDLQRRRGTHRYVENLPAILRIQDYFLELADRYDVPIVDNVSIDGSVMLIIRHVVETLRKRGKGTPG